MKKQIMIIEDNYYKFFTIKQVIETHLRLKVKVVGAKDAEELIAAANGVGAGNLIMKPEGGIIELIEILKKQNLNRRNSEVTLIITPEMDRAEGMRISEMRMAHAA